MRTETMNPKQPTDSNAKTAYPSGEASPPVTGSANVSGAREQNGAGGWRDAVTCPYCGHEHEDSRDMGCPDMDWTEETECAMCEKTFEWSRLTTTQYLTRPVAGEGDSGNDSEPSHSPSEKLTDSPRETVD
jgi:DNA-directed RNA polymerase subunit RPC12/RpoP